MKDFNQFATQAAKNRIATSVLMKRGGFHYLSPNNQEMEREIKGEVDVVIEVLRKYHEWLHS